MRLARRLALSGATVAATLGRRVRAATPTVRIGVLTDLSGQLRPHDSFGNETCGEGRRTSIHRRTGSRLR
jgi:hypothetical protein